jgi:hypothetical protein
METWRDPRLELVINITVRHVEVESSRYLLLRDLSPDRIIAMQHFMRELMGSWDLATGSRETAVAAYLAAFPGDTEQQFIDWCEALWADGYGGPVLQTILERAEEEA